MTRVVVAAAIVRGDPPRLLAACRARPPELAGRWELPGGKVEPGESEPQALVRECREELGVDVEVGERVGDDVATVDATAVLRVFWATIFSDAAPTAHEHSALRWLTADQLGDVDWLDADLPVIDVVRRSLRP